MVTVKNFQEINQTHIMIPLDNTNNIMVSVYVYHRQSTSQRQRDPLQTQHRCQSRLDLSVSKKMYMVNVPRIKQDAIQIDNHHATTPPNHWHIINNTQSPPAPLPQNLHRPHHQNKQRLLLPAKYFQLALSRDCSTKSPRVCASWRSTSNTTITDLRATSNTTIMDLKGGGVV